MAGSEPSEQVMQRQHEQELIQRVLDGDPEAVGALVDYLTPSVLAVAQRYLAAWSRKTGVSDWKEGRRELFQEVMVRLCANDYQTLRRFDPDRASLKTYVQRVARNTCHTLATKPGRETQTLLEEPVDDGPDPVLRTEARFLLRRLHDQLVATLSPTDLQLFQMMVVDERPFEWVSEQTGFEVPYLHLRKFRLRKKARAMLEVLSNEAQAQGAAQ